MNHEYTDDGLLHPDGLKTWTAEKVRKAQAAHGVSVIEVALEGRASWQMVRPSRLCAALHRGTPFAVWRPGRRPPADAHRRRPVGPHACWAR
jgi:secreted PhoX family phosphatase